MSTTTQNRDTRSYLMGTITGAAIAVAAFSMMGQGYSKPADRPAQGPGGAPVPQAAPIAADEYFVTPGNDSNTTARLWRRPAGKNMLEYVSEFQPVKTGR